MLFAAGLILWDRITIQRMCERHLRLTEELITKIQTLENADDPHDSQRNTGGSG